MYLEGCGGLLVGMVPTLHSLCYLYSFQCDFTALLIKMLSLIFLFLESGLILFPLTPRIWWKRCGVISKPKRPHTLACSLGPLPATWEAAFITSWKTGDCASHWKLSKMSWSQLTRQLNALARLTPRRTAQPSSSSNCCPSESRAKYYLLH